jgi:NAD(P)-dependent dehydrogenase (short-subunit alcohol dehydrogenase family)
LPNRLHRQAAQFPIASYSSDDITAAFESIQSHFPSPTFSIRAAIYNSARSVWKSFLDVTPQDIQETLQVDVVAAFAFSRQAILAFKENEVNETTGKKGTLVFTGATASLRGNVTTSACAAGKSGTRALSQSLAKEFGKQNIHVRFCTTFCRLHRIIEFCRMP